MKFRFPALPADAAGRSRLLNGAARLGVGVLSRVLMYLFLIASSFVLLYPVLYMLSMAFRPAADMSNPNVIWIPTALTLENIKGIWEYVQYPKLLGNTLLLCGVSSVLQVVVCCLVGYGFARFRFRGRGVLMGLLLLTIVLPPMAENVRTEVCDTFGITEAMQDEVLPELHAIAAETDCTLLDYEWNGSCITDDDTQFFDGFHLDEKYGLPDWTEELFTDIG